MRLLRIFGRRGKNMKQGAGPFAHKWLFDQTKKYTQIISTIPESEHYQNNSSKYVKRAGA